FIVYCKKENTTEDPVIPGGSTEFVIEGEYDSMSFKPTCFIMTSDSGFALICNTIDGIAKVVKLDSGLKVSWVKTLGDHYLHVDGIVQNSEGNLIALGTIKDPGAGPDFVSLVLLNQDGQTIWQKNHKRAGASIEGDAMIQVLDKGIILSVTTCNTGGTGKTEIFRINNDGDFILAEVLSSAENYQVSEIQFYKEQLFMKGKTNLLCADTSGIVLWTRERFCDNASRFLITINDVLQDCGDRTEFGTNELYIYHSELDGAVLSMNFYSYGNFHKVVDQCKATGTDYCLLIRYANKNAGPWTTAIKKMNRNQICIAECTLQDLGEDYPWAVGWKGNKYVYLGYLKNQQGRSGLEIRSGTCKKL
ncbi:MAG: hypothetical protein ACM3N9_01255, partial [Syntrophothermus sp.]